MYLGILPCLVANFSARRASSSVPDSKSRNAANSHLKYQTVVSFPLFKWVINLRRRLVLLSVYMIDFLALASSYAPSSFGSPSKCSRVNLRHLLTIGIIQLTLRNSDGQCDVGTWTDIVQVAAGWLHTIGLRHDGTVVAVGYNDYGQCNVGGWDLN